MEIGAVREERGAVERVSTGGLCRVHHAGEAPCGPGDGARGWSWRCARTLRPHHPGQGARPGGAVAQGQKHAGGTVKGKEI